MLRNGQEDQKIQDLDSFKNHFIRDCCVLISDIKLDPSLKFVNNTVFLSKSRNKYTCYVCFTKFFTVTDLKLHRKLHRDNDVEDSENKSEESENGLEYATDGSTDSDNESSSWESSSTNSVCESDRESRTVNPENNPMNSGNDLNLQLETSTLYSNLKTTNVIKMPFSCITCQITFDIFRNLRTHKSKCGQCIFSCELCSWNFQTANLFMVHVLCHKVDVNSCKFFSCEGCQSIFNTYFQLTKHESNCRYLLNCKEGRHSDPTLLHSNNTNTVISDTETQSHAAVKTEAATQISCELCYDVCDSEEDFKTHMEFHNELAVSERKDTDFTSNVKMSINATQHNKSTLTTLNSVESSSKTEKSVRVGPSLNFNKGQKLVGQRIIYCELNEIQNKLKNTILPNQPGRDDVPLKPNKINTNSASTPENTLRSSITNSKSAIINEKPVESRLNRNISRDDNRKSSAIRGNLNLPSHILQNNHISIRSKIIAISRKPTESNQHKEGAHPKVLQSDSKRILNVSINSSKNNTNVINNLASSSRNVNLVNPKQNSSGFRNLRPLLPLPSPIAVNCKNTAISQNPVDTHQNNKNITKSLGGSSKNIVNTPVNKKNSNTWLKNSKVPSIMSHTNIHLAPKSKTTSQSQTQTENNQQDGSNLSSTSNSFASVSSNNSNCTNNTANNWANNNSGNSNVIYLMNHTNNLTVVNGISSETQTPLINNSPNIGYYIIPHTPNTNINFSSSNSQMTAVNTDGLQLFTQTNQTSSTVLEQSNVLNRNITEGLQLFTPTNQNPSTLFERNNVLNTTISGGFPLFTPSNQNSSAVLQQNNLVNTNVTEGWQFFASSNQNTATALDQNNIVYSLPLERDSAIAQNNSMQFSSNVPLMTNSCDNSLYYLTSNKSTQSSESMKSRVISILPRPST